jgi:hypothetical protein
MYANNWLYFLSAVEVTIQYNSYKNKAQPVNYILLASSLVNIYSFYPCLTISSLFCAQYFEYTSISVKYFFLKAHYYASESSVISIRYFQNSVLVNYIHIRIWYSLQTFNFLNIQTILSLCIIENVDLLYLCVVWQHQCLTFSLMTVIFI